MFKNLLRADEKKDYERERRILNRIATFQSESVVSHGLTIHELTPFLDRIGEAIEVDQVTGIVNEFTNQYGVTFEIPERWDMRNLTTTFTAVDKITMDVPTYKYGAAIFMRSLAAIPEEVIRLSNFKKIQLVNDLNPVLSKSDTQKVGVADNFANVMYLDNVGFNSYSIGMYFRHEISHGIDATVCGDVAIYKGDPEYEALNPVGFQYGTVRDDLLDFVFTQYASKNSLEDKAELIGAMLVGLNDYETYSPILRAKYELLLARLESNIPGISGYLRSIGLSNSIELASNENTDN